MACNAKLSSNPSLSKALAQFIFLQGASLSLNKCFKLSETKDYESLKWTLLISGYEDYKQDKFSNSMLLHSSKTW